MESKNQGESLVEVRRILEIAAVKMAAERRTLEDLREIQTAQNAFRDQIIDRNDGDEEDLLFHLKVVTAGKNDLLKSLFMKIIPELLELWRKNQDKDSQKMFESLREHDRIIEHIISQNKEKAAEEMKLHIEKQGC